MLKNFLRMQKKKCQDRCDALRSFEFWLTYFTFYSLTVTLETVRPGRDADPSTPSSAEVKNRVELYLYSP